MALLTVALALALTGGLSRALEKPTVLGVNLLMSFAAVMTGFLLHELAHKWMAQKYGCWAEYRGNRNGLLLALLMGAVGFLIAAPGAVMVAAKALAMSSATATTILASARTKMMMAVLPPARPT